MTRACWNRIARIKESKFARVSPSLLCSQGFRFATAFAANSDRNEQRSELQHLRIARSEALSRKSRHCTGKRLRTNSPKTANKQLFEMGRFQSEVLAVLFPPPESLRPLDFCAASLILCHVHVMSHAMTVVATLLRHCMCRVLSFLHRLLRLHCTVVDLTTLCQLGMKWTFLIQSLCAFCSPFLRLLWVLSWQPPSLPACLGQAYV